MSDSVLAKLDIARQALVEAKTIQETKTILDVATAAEILAKRQKMGEEAINYATSIKVEALAQLGRMLHEMELSKGGRPTETPTNSEGVILPTLKDMGLDYKTSKLAQDIAKLPEDKLEQVKTGVVAISKALEKAHVSYNSGENEWYTPSEIIEMARNTMDGIDLDPASSDIANKTVMAKIYYTVKDDGLSKDWGGRVWMNPPYAQPLISKFTEKLTHEYNTGNIKEACVLVNNATETYWFQTTLMACNAVCFPLGRIKFIDVNGNTGSAPLQGQVILYFGGNRERFRDSFKKMGIILWREV